MKNQTDFQRLVKEFQYSSKRFESLLLSWESLNLAQQDEVLCGRYSGDAIQTTKANLQEEISYCGRDVANLALWLNNACAFPGSRS